MSLREGGATLPSSVDHRPLPVRRAQLVEALAHDAHALAHLLHADDLAVVIVAVQAHGDVEIHLLVERVRLRLAQVPGHAAAADDRPREAPLPAIVKREDADIDVALLEDAVADDEGIEIVEHLQERIAERLDVVDQLRLDIHVDAAGPEVIGVHARAGNALIENHELLALLEAPERRRERADVHGLRGHVEEVREKTPDFGIEHADQLGAAGHLDAEQLLDRHADRRVPGSSARRSRAGRNRGSPERRSCTRSASRCRGAAGRYADRRARRPRRPAPARGAARRARPGAAGRN